MGRWIGKGQNTGFKTSWTIDLVLTAAPSGGRCGRIEYTNPACGGTLETCNVVDGDIHTKEKYTHSSPDCAPAGKVIIRCEGDTMRYSWIGWERVDTVLHRPVGAAPPKVVGDDKREKPSADDTEPSNSPENSEQPMGEERNGEAFDQSLPPAVKEGGACALGCDISDASVIGSGSLFLFGAFVLLRRSRSAKHKKSLLKK